MIKNTTIRNNKRNLVSYIMMTSLLIPTPPIFKHFYPYYKKIVKNRGGGYKVAVAFFVLLNVLPFSLAEAKNAGGCLKVTQRCEAYQSFRKQTNPGDVEIKEGELYPILERSRKSKAYRINIKGIKRSARWVSGKCGEVLSSCDAQSTQAMQSQAQIKLSKKAKLTRYSKNKKNRKTPQYLFALSWQPTFCEGHSRKKECRTQTKNRYDASHWSLHGLWPQPRSNAYCGVSDMDKGIDRNKRWHLLAPVKLSQKTALELALIMPGASSNLQRHEWIKHGTCYGSDAEDYYSDAIRLTKAVNNSIVGKLFNRGVGKRVTLKQVRAHFDKAFGKGAGDKVDMRCDRKGRVSELWINLKGEIEDETELSSLLKNSIRAGSSCFTGLIDPANR